MRRWWGVVVMVFPVVLGLMASTACPMASVAVTSIQRDDAALRANVPEGLWIWIDIHQKNLTLYEGTRVKKRYVIATGTGETPSPIGIYRITNRFSGELGGFGTRFLGLNVPWGQFGIHGTNRPQSIGQNASHGCIRMHVKDSEELYAQVGVGTKVVLEGGPYGLLDFSLPTLRPGDRGSHVAAVQAKLLALGYAYAWPDGIYGPATQAAVTKARKALKLPEKDLIDYGFYQAVGLSLFE